MNLKITKKMPYAIVDYSREFSVEKQLTEIEGRLMLIFAFKKDEYILEEISEVLKMVYNIHERTLPLFEDAFKSLYKSKALRIEGFDPKIWEKTLLSNISVNPDVLKRIKQNNFYTLSSSQSTISKLIQIPIYSLGDNDSKIIPTKSSLEKFPLAKIFNKEYFQKMKKKVLTEENIFTIAEELVPHKKNQIKIEETINDKDSIHAINEEFSFRLSIDNELMSNDNKSEEFIKLVHDKKIKCDFKELIEEKWKTKTKENVETGEGIPLSDDELTSVEKYNSNLQFGVSLYKENGKFFRIFHKKVKVIVGKQEISPLMAFKAEFKREELIQYLIDNSKFIDAHLDQELLKEITILFIKNKKYEKLPQSFITEEYVNSLPAKDLVEIDIDLLYSFLKFQKMEELFKYDAKHARKYIENMEKMPHLSYEDAIYKAYFNSLDEILDIKYFAKWKPLMNAKRTREELEKEFSVKEMIDKSFMKIHLAKIKSLHKLSAPIQDVVTGKSIRDLEAQILKLSDLSVEEVEALAISSRKSIEKLICYTEELEKIQYGKMKEIIANSKKIAIKEKKILSEAWPLINQHMHYSKENDYSKETISKIKNIIPLVEKIEKKFKRKADKK